MIKKKIRLNVFMLVTMLSLFLCGCMEKEQEWPGYNGTTEGYTYFYSEGRDRLWEEDILFMAEKFLQGHPKLSDSNFVIRIVNNLYDDIDSEYSNALYDENMRIEFIEQINLLIPRISELNDFGVQYETMRISALINDAHSGVNTDVGDTLPIFFELVGEESEFLYCTVRTTHEYQHLLGSRLVAINGVSIEDIVSRFAMYLPHENNYWIAHTIANPFDYCYLTEKPALQAIGVVDLEADEVEISFETEFGLLVETVKFIRGYEYLNGELINHDMVTSTVLINHQNENFWYVVIADEATPYLYVRFNRMREQSTSFNQFYTMVATELKNSEVPLKLIIDFRDNGGGELQVDTAMSFANAVNRYETNGTYILINGGSFSAGMYTPYVLAETIDGAMLVGSPTGQPGNCFGAPFIYYTPNFEMQFRVSDNYICGTPAQDLDAIYPDVTVYQTWEDYQNNVDTVLEYVLALK